MAGVKPSRKQRAAQTRARTLDAAYACFTTAGYPGTTMADIADRAGVAVQTLYFGFHTKAELLARVFERAVLGPDEVPPPRQRWHRAAEEAAEIEEALAGWTTGVAAIVARVAPLRPVFDGVAGDEEVAALWANGERLREQGYRAFLTAAAERHGLAPGADLDELVDAALVLAGPTGHRGFVEDRGWPLEAWADYTARLLRRSFA